MAHYAGVDLGASNIRAVVGDDEAEIRGRDRRPTPKTAGIDVTEAILDSLHSACEAASVDPGSIAAAGIGSIGPLDLAEGVVRNPANLPDSIEYIPLVGPIEKLTDSPVYLHNDTSAGVIGERFHADTTPDDMAYLTISSGIGAGVCVDGNVLSGWDGNAGEIGHITVDPTGAMTCGCGNPGHWEAYCSGENLPQYASYLHAGQETKLPVEDPDFSAPDIFEHAGEDPFADRILDRFAEWNALGVSALIHAYAPIVVYIGGAVALNNPDTVLGEIRDRIPDLVMTNLPEIRLTTLGDDVVVRGALASAMTAGTGDRRQMRR
ncbi:MAG: ROK family protein [Natronomonas sp.]